MRRSAARLTVAVALATATVLGSGLPALAQGPNPLPSPGTQPVNCRTNKVTCGRGPDGRLTDCPKPLAA